MRKNLCVGILKETKPNESRAPLTPSDVNWLIKRGIGVEVESSPSRTFKDIEYKKSGAKLVNRFSKAALLMGVKAPRAEDLYRDKIYMIFSHTVKGQLDNLPLLKDSLIKNITLIDYEKITDQEKERIVSFGRFAGICGLVDSLYYLGKRLEWKGIKTPFQLLKPAYKYASLKSVKLAMSKVGSEIRSRGFSKKLSPFIIGIAGHGRVSGGVQEILKALNPVEIHPRDMKRFISRQRGMRNKIYKIVFLREEKFRSKNGGGFYFEEYLKNPKRFESNLDAYLPYLNLLVHTSYWDVRYPRLVTKKMAALLSKKRPFRLELASDLSCDINGSIEFTHKATTRQNPTFTYNPKTKKFTDGYKAKGITVLAIDNLPSELPRDSSQEFSAIIRDYVYQIAAHGARDLINHAAIPVEVRRAVIIQGGKLADDFKYLAKWLK